MTQKHKDNSGHERMGGLWIYTCACANQDGETCIQCGKWFAWGDRFDKYGNRVHICGANICEDCAPPRKYQCDRCGLELNKDDFHNCPIPIA